MTLHTAAVLRKQDEMATVAVIKYQRNLEDNCFATFRLGTYNA
jgi:hypothetical protein